MENDILDSDLMEDSGFVPEKTESLVWEGSPKVYVSISMLEVFIRDANVSAVALLQFVLSVTLLIKSIYLLGGAENLGSISKVAVLLAVAMIPDLLKYVRKCSTQYYLTTERVVISTLYYFSKKQYSISLDDIVDVSYEGYKDTYGALFLKVQPSCRVKTYDFFTGAKRHFPTLELVADYAAIKQQMDELKMERSTKT